MVKVLLGFDVSAVTLAFYLFIYFFASEESKNKKENETKVDKTMDQFN